MNYCAKILHVFSERYCRAEQRSNCLTPNHAITSTWRRFMSDNNVLLVSYDVMMNGCDEMLKSIFMHKAGAVS